MPIPGLTSVQAMCIGAGFGCVVESGGVECWGQAVGAGGGVPQPTPGPVRVPGLQANVQTITCDFWDVCANIGGDVLQCWGRNDFGELGDGSLAFSATPVLVGPWAL